MRVRLLLGCALLLAVGCGGRKVVPVSGTVTMNTVPLKGATVYFQPIAPEGSREAGPASYGKTDENGKYTLKTDRGEEGAWVGRYRVRITVMKQERGTGDERPPRGGWPVMEQIPDRYNEKSDMTRDVTPDGPNEFNFSLTKP